MEQLRQNPAAGYHAAIYCRLSKDDENAGKSTSIQTQKMMLEKICLEQDPRLQRVCDDGYSGLNFAPGYTQEQKQLGGRLAAIR